jgi:hypothetical protein
VDPNPKLEVVGTVDTLPATDPAHDQRTAAQLVALRRLLAPDLDCVRAGDFPDSNN